MTNYYHKYLKYKKKNLLLKSNLVGGGSALEELCRKSADTVVKYKYDNNTWFAQLECCIQPGIMLKNVKHESNLQPKSPDNYHWITPDKYILLELLELTPEESKKYLGSIRSV